MLRSLNDIQNYAIEATDGEIGHVKDLTFDEKTWVIRYLVVDAGTWLGNRQVLISPIGVDFINWREQTIPVSLNRQQVEKSPAFDSLKPLSREHEIEYLGHYQLPYYWGGTSIWGSEIYPRRLTTPSVGMDAVPFNLLQAEQGDFPVEEPLETKYNPALHNTSRLKSCRVVAKDGDVGQVTDLIFDEETWAIRYLVVATADWWGKHQLLIVPQSAYRFDWSEATINLNMTRHEVKAFPHREASVKVEHADCWIVEVARESVREQKALAT